MVTLLRHFLSADNRFLSFDCELVESHAEPPISFQMIASPICKRQTKASPDRLR